MPTALSDLPGYQGNPQLFARDHVRDLAGNVADNGDARLAVESSVGGVPVYPGHGRHAAAA